MARFALTTVTGTLFLLPLCALAQKPPAPQAAPAQPAAQSAAPAQSPSSTPAPNEVPPPPPIPSPQPPQPNIPAAELLWSTVLDKDAPTPLQPGSEFIVLHSAALAGDRAVAVFEAQPQTTRGGRPFTTYRLATLDLANGKILAQRDLHDQARPFLFSTDDAHLLLQQSSLIRLNPDLTESGEKFALASKSPARHLFFLSPDGGTLGLWSDWMTSLLDAHTLQPLGLRIRGPEPTAVSKRALLSNDPAWASEFPGALSFMVLKDLRSPHLLYRGPCAGHPVFLGEDRILTVACAKVFILDLTGKLLKELPLGASFGAFAGLSRDGSRFAIESSDYPPTDPSYSATELFTLYDAATLAPVATVTPDSLPEARSWAAFSQDGKSFLTGSPKKVSLYKIP
jgi:hypothetical protein